MAFPLSAAPLLQLLLALTLSTCAQAFENCAQYESKSCLFSKQVTVANAKCKPRTCDFSTAEEFGFKCAFPETGIFSPSGAACADPFLSTIRSSASPCGAERCCAASSPGAFLPDGTFANGAQRFSYQPLLPETCRYTPMTRGQIMATLEGINAPLVVIGDSMMRQLFLRLVMMMRGQERLLDYRLHTHAQYLLCDDRDAFRISANSKSGESGSYNITYLREKIPAFFGLKEGPGRAVAKKSLSLCSKKPIEMHYVMAPSFGTQTPAIPKYQQVFKSPNVKPMYVINVGYWEGIDFVPAFYLQSLSLLRNKATKVFLVGIATGYKTADKRRDAYRRRNEQLKTWAQEQGAPFFYVDYDSLTTTTSEPKPAGPFGTDSHFMCGIVWHRRSKPTVRIGKASQYTELEAQIPVGKMERIQMTRDGKCSDETNRNLWQMIFNVMIPPGT
ncbi:hypothetical protein NADE_008693 [Nannochloris sp. 'desiccata']|nr:hypothetical protein NADE_008693 [Chlorella desiccata (nom. nud.)]